MFHTIHIVTLYDIMSHCIIIIISHRALHHITFNDLWYSFIRLVSWLSLTYLPSYHQHVYSFEISYWRWLNIIHSIPSLSCSLFLEIPRRPWTSKSKSFECNDATRGTVGPCKNSRGKWLPIWVLEKCIIMRIIIGPLILVFPTHIEDVSIMVIFS